MPDGETEQAEICRNEDMLCAGNHEQGGYNLRYLKKAREISLVLIANSSLYDGPDIWNSSYAVQKMMGIGGAEDMWASEDKFSHAYDKRE